MAIIIPSYQANITLIYSYHFHFRIAQITVLDKLPGPDIIRWFATAALVSLPFAYISLGLSFPETLVASVNQVRR